MADHKFALIVLDSDQVNNTVAREVATFTGDTIEPRDEGIVAIRNAKMDYVAVIRLAEGQSIKQLD